MTTRIDGLCKRGHDTRLPGIGYAFIKNGIAFIMCKRCIAVRQQVRRTQR